MWKRTSLILISLIILLAITETQATGSITLVAGTIIKTKYGQLVVSRTMIMGSMTAYANGTIMFNVTNFELSQIVYQFSLTSYGNGTFPIKFWGRIPLQVIANNALSSSYVFPSEIIQYNSVQNTPLIVIYGLAKEGQTVLFRDDFLYTNPLIESSWTIDQYQNPGINSGEYTSSGYLIMKATTIAQETVHVTNAMYQSQAYSTGTSVKRKITMALIPFAKKEAATADIRAGFAPLLSTGVFPGASPYGTPDFDQGGNCAMSAIATDNIGIEYLFMDNSGTVIASNCYDNGGSGTANAATLESGLDPTKYTVFTIVTYGIFCSTCPDNAYTGTSWVWFRIYQEDATGKVVSSTDKNMNFTSNVSPLYQTNYAFITQRNSNGGATGQLSKIDFLSVQNYGSPVCLIAPAGFLCSRLPPVPSGIIGNNGIVGLIAWLANQIGFGDEQMGALILFFAMFFGAAFLPYYFSRNLPVGAFGAMLTLGFFTYVGFLPIYTLILVFMGGAAVVVMLVLRMLSGTSMGGFGGSDGS